MFHKPVAWCLENVDSREFSEWQAYREIVSGKAVAAKQGQQSTKQMANIFKTFAKAQNAQRHKS